MLKENITITRFSPKKPEVYVPEEYRRELELLKRELENEKLKAQEARKRYISDLKQYKETSEREKGKLVDELTSKWEQQKIRELQTLRDSVLRERELEIKQLMRWKDEEIREVQTFLQKERDTAVRQARQLQKQLIDELVNRGYSRKSNYKGETESPHLSECQCRIQDVLSQLRWDYDSEQASQIRHLKVELDLERSLFIKYILDRSDSNASAIRDTAKPSVSKEIKFGRHSLGNVANRQWSLDETCSKPTKVAGFRSHLRGSALTRTQSFETAFPRSDSPLNSTEKSWKASPEIERILMSTQRESYGNHTSEITFAFLETKNEFAAWSPLQEKLSQFPQIYRDSIPDSSHGTETSSCCTPLSNVSDYHHDTHMQLKDASQHSLNVSNDARTTEELLSSLRDLEQRCKELREENIILRKSSVPETEEKVKRLKRKNAELAVIAKRLEERAQKLQEANLKMVNTPIHLNGANLETCRKSFACQRAKDMREQGSALLEKDKQIETLKQECLELQAKLCAGKMEDFPSLLKFTDFNRLLHESQKEVLRLQKQIAMKYLKESLQLSHSSPTPPEAVCFNRLIHPEQPTQDPDNSVLMTSGDSFQEVELRRKRKECEILEQEVKKKQKRCLELEVRLQEVQGENERLVEKNSRLCSTVKWAAKVEAENADLKRQLSEVTEERDSALKENRRLQSKLENLEQVLKHMRDVAERRQQLEKDHEDAIIALERRQDEVKRLQQAQVEAKKEHEGAVQLLENTLDTLQAKVKVLEDKCRSQTEQFSLLSQELEKFRLQTGNIDLLASTLVNSELPPPQCCSTPSLSSVKQDRSDEKSNTGVQKRLPETPHATPKVTSAKGPKHAAAKEKPLQKKPEALPHTSSKSESTHESSKSSPTPEVDTASEMEDLEADSVSLNPEPETRPTAKLQVFLARYSYNPFDGPNENPESELPLTAGEYIYVYGDMDDDGFYEGELMDGRRGLVPSNFVERVSDDDLIAFQPGEVNELSQSSGQDVSFLSGSSIGKSEEDDEPSSLSPLPLQGNSNGATEVSAVPYPRKPTLIKQLARSIVVGWEPPLVAAGSGNIQSYNIYVDNELRQNVQCGGQTKALIEKLELKTRTYRISVQSMTEDGCSDRMRCTLLVGHGYTLAPTQLRVRSLSATSAEVTWQPCNSNYSHALYLNEESYGLTKAGTYWYTFGSLRPSTMYNVKVEARPQRVPLELPLERREPRSTVMQFTTPAAGPPDAPLDVQVELGPKPGVLLITWLPVTIDAAGTSNGVRVTGYAVYANGQKVLDVTSPTAGSVLIGTSYLHLLQVSREITVRTMSPNGESQDSVPAWIPSAFLNSCKRPSWSQNFSNTSLTCEPPLVTQHEKKPSMPLNSSSPCLLHNQAASICPANLSFPTSCIRGDLNSLPVRIAPQIPVSPLSASSGYCQTSSSLEVHVSGQDLEDQLSSSIPDAATMPLAVIGNGLEETKNNLKSKGTVQNSQAPDTKKCEFGTPMLLCLNATNAKDECSSPEAEVQEDAKIISSLGCRRASIEEFLEVGKNEDTDSSGPDIKAEDASGILHSSVAHINHSRSSNLSDILEEEEEEEEDYSDLKYTGQKRGQILKSPSIDSPGKLDCCETDSDEEILEKILDLPLQKHCSKKLFSIPEVTEEEDEEENTSLGIVYKGQHFSKDISKCQYGKPCDAISQKTVSEACAKLSTERCSGDISKNCNKAECFKDDCVFQDWQQKMGSCVPQTLPYFQKPPVSDSNTWDTKRNSSVYERANCISEPTWKKQNDSREHCSRMLTNANQNARYRCQNVRDPVAYNTTRETSKAGSRSLKKSSKSLDKHQPFVPTYVKSKAIGLSTRPLEIDIEYDTEDEEEPSAPAYYAIQAKACLWEDSSQTDGERWSESSDYSESTQIFRRKNYVKKQLKEQAGSADCLKRHTSLLHIDQIHKPQQGSYKDDQGSKAANNKTIRTVRWECARKDEWSKEPKEQMHSEKNEIAASEKTKVNNLASDSESDAAHVRLQDCHQDNPCQEDSSVRVFVALFDYDPETMSPNPDAYTEELPFKEGHILQVCGDKDTDGFYQGKHGGRTGYIPCNMVSELHIQSEEVKMELLRQGYLPSPSLLNDLEYSIFSPPPHAPLGRSAIPPPKPRRSKKVQPTSATENNASDKHFKTSKSEPCISRKMVAMFDYNPKESSPNMDVEAELSFRAGDIITVFGPMDEDGFYYGDLNGRRGFVPSNYLEVSQAHTDQEKLQGAAHARGEKERLRRRTK
ncbi:peripheral-type benzodiazepine receptor-associated protein 1 [Gastrophryne carolinensis]